ncbi:MULTISPECIES: AAA family ATPase [Leptolyngbya]|uniref:AAA family ATPase n=1 Tax=Leptolyngbya TaxID=47251 RepID=UPI0018F01175|nr:AAA family ATPase [Leptolyngbya sp. FACHB-1624]
MDDLFQEIEALVDQGFEGLLDIVRVIEGREPREPEFRVNQSENVDHSSPTDERQSFFSENTVLSTPSSEDSVQPTLAGVGGLSSVLRELRELVELPLKRPNVLAALGLEPTTGVLLTGPPGTGKTLTARALATDLDVNYIAIVGPEVIGKYYGEAESRLRSIFQKAARSAPCIIFIDEIDSLAPDRSKVEGEVEKRVVAQLLSLMDGFAKTKGIIVLAATNRPDHLDPALRRPGRFDREIAFRVPDRGGRLEILEILTAMMPLHESVDLNAIADLSGGMVGADLKALSQQAAYLALRRLLPSLDSPMPAQMSVTQVDFLEAIRHIKPAVLRSIEIEAPKVTWDAIGGLDHIKQTLQDSVEGALLYPELYDHTKAKAPRGILLWGEPGTGKTLLAKAVAAQARANFIAVNGPELLSKWVGASEQAVRELFTKARQASPCVVFVDEIDTLAPARGRYQSDSGVSDRVVGQLLTELDGLHDCTNVLFVGATNRPETLDPALLRAGRLDLQLKVDLPDHMSRLAILHVHNRDRPLEEVELDSFAAQTEGWNGADLALLSNQAALEAVRRYRTQGMNDPTCLRITMDDFTIAYQRLLLQREMAR